MYIRKRGTKILNFTVEQLCIIICVYDSSVGIATDYMLGIQGLIATGEGFFPKPQRPDRHWCPPKSESNRYRTLLPSDKVVRT